MAFDTVHELDWITLRRDEVKPTAGDHHRFRQPKHAIGNGIAMVMIVEEPGFLAAVAQGSLNVGEIHAYLIVNDGGRAGGTNAEGKHNRT